MAAKGAVAGGKHGLPGRTAPEAILPRAVLGAGDRCQMDVPGSFWEALGQSHAPGTAGWFEVQSGALERGPGSHWS